MFLKPAQIIQDLKSKGYLLEGFVAADLGCGSGYFTSLLAEAVGPQGRVKAVDIDEEVLSGAKEFVELTGYKNVDYILGNLEEKIDIESDSCDLVLISQVLYQSDFPDNILKEAFRILKPNHFLVVVEPAKENVLFSDQKTFTKQEIEDLIVKSKFKILESDLKDNFHLIIATK